MRPRAEVTTTRLEYVGEPQRPPRDRDARPSLEEMLALRADRKATVRRLIAGLTDEKLAGIG